ncbi:hypothetical protein RT97_23645, partial [Variovorax paradoxus]
MVFTPAPNFNGTASFTYTVSDGNGGTSTATVTVNVGAVNDAPVATDDVATTPINTPLANIPVLANDTDVDGDPLTVTGATVNPALGTVTVNPNGTLDFTPANNVTGPVQITYTVSDGKGGTDTGVLTVNIGANTPPQSADATVNGLEDTPLTLTLANFAFTDTDAGQSLASVRIDTLPTNGTLLLNGVAVTPGQAIAVNEITSGRLTFVPAANGNGAAYASFTFSVQDSGGAFDATPNTITFNIAPVNDAPVANPETVVVNEDTPATGNVLANDTDVDGNALTVTQFVVNGSTFTAGQTATIAGVGSLVINADGSYTFAPAANYNGPVPVATYRVSDGALTADSTLTISVTPVDDAFTDADETVSVNEDSLLTGSVLTGTTSVDGPVSVTSFSVAGDATTYAAGQTATIAGVGTLVINANGSYTFTPAANYNGPVPVVTYSMTDGSSADTSTLTITVAPVDDPFTDASETVTTNEDTPLTGSVLTGTTSVDGPVTVTGFTVAGDATTYTAGQTATITGVGTLVINANGSYTFTPAANYNGPVPVVTYSLTDGSSGDTSTLTISVTAANDAPAGNPDTVTVTEDVPATGNVLTNDTDVDGDALTVTSFSVAGDGTFTAGQTATIAGVGTLVINANGSYTFTPAANYNGPVPVITYTVSDGTATATSTLTLTVSAVNDAPVNTLPTGWTTNEDATVGLTGLQITDADAGSSPMRVTLSVPSGSLTAASGGGVTVTGSGTGTLVLEGSQANINAYLASAARPNYVPVANFNGSVTLTMTTSDLGNTGTGGTLTDTDTATIGIADVNDAPAGTDRTVTINEDGTYTFSAADFPITDANDTPAHSLQSVVITTLPDAAQGVLRLNGVAVTAGQVIPVGSLGQLTFTPAANVNGAGIGAFTFQVVDSGGTANGGQNTDPSPNTFSFNITAVNDAPVAGDDVATTPINTPLANIPVLANDADVDGDPLTITAATVNPALGTVTINANGTLSFTPANNVSGPVQITYTVSDGKGGTDTAILTVNVGANTPPQSADTTVNGTEDTPVVLTPANFPFTDTDAGQSLASVRIDTLPVNGTLLLDGVAIAAGQTVTVADITAGRLTFVPGANGNGATYASFTFSVQDSGGAFDAAPNTLTFNIAPVNDAPAANDDTGTTDEDTALTGNVLGNDSDVDGDVLTVTQFVVNGSTFNAGQTATIAGVGSLVINANGSYTFTPAANYNGPVPVVTYTVSDGTLGDTATLTLSVTPVDDAFTDANETVTTNEDTPLTGSVLTGTTSVDGPVTVTGFTVAGDPTAYAAGQTADIAGVGTLTVNADGSYTFTPAANYNGPVPLVTYGMTDGSSTDTSTLAITVAPVNDAPVNTLPASYPATEDTTLALTGISVSDVDAAGGTITVTLSVGSGTLAAGPGGGVGVSGSGTGTLVLTGTQAAINAYLAATAPVFTPAANANGPVLLTMTTDDGGNTGGGALTDTDTSTIDVAPVNDAPVGNADTGTVVEDTPASGNVLANDTDVDGNPLTVTQFSVGGNTFTAGSTATLTGVGALTINSDGSYTFAPSANYNGPVPVVTYTVSDGTATASSTLTLTVTPVDDPFTDANENASTNEDTALTGSVLNGTSSVDGPVTVVGFSVAGDATAYTAGQTATIANVGTLVINSDGSFTFTPAANYNGPVPVVTYNLTDGSSGNVSTLTITVLPVADAPVANPDTVAATEDTPLSIPAATLVGNDTDVDGDTLTISSVQGAVNGTVSLVGGNVVFTPAPNFNGTASFTYTVS